MTTHVHTWGEGPRQFLGIHGWGGGWQTYEPLVPFMPTDISFHAVDLPGYGHTRAPGAWSLETMAASVCDAVDRIEGPITLVGNCSGAIFGMLGVLERPERFERLVVIDPFAYFPWYFRIMTWPALGRMFYGVTFENPLGRVVTNASLKAKRTEDTHLTSSFEALNHDAVFAHLQLLDAVGPHTRFSPLKNHAIDLLIGENTFDAIRRSADMWQEIWPKSRRFTLSGAAHLPIQEATQSLAAHVFER